ncbi:MAG: hypothetical protein KKE20_05600 [Nanoarchaeota archaeon]|nr:hypothetical protein [Nanoarchaeota archaeon]
MAILNFFGNIKRVLRKMRKEIAELRASVNEWIVHLNSENDELKARVAELDRRLRELEMERVAKMMKIELL